MYLSDYTIPEAEVIYQREVIRAAGRFFIFLVVAVFLYFVIKAFLEDHRNYMEHERFMARQKAGAIIGQAGFDQAKAAQTNNILKMKKKIDSMYEEIAKKNKHICMLENTMETMHFGDVAEKIRKEIEDGKNESEDRS